MFISQTVDSKLLIFSNIQLPLVPIQCTTRNSEPASCGTSLMPLAVVMCQSRDFLLSNGGLNLRMEFKSGCRALLHTFMLPVTEASQAAFPSSSWFSMVPVLSPHLKGSRLVSWPYGNPSLACFSARSPLLSSLLLLKLSSELLCMLYSDIIMQTTYRKWSW